MTRFEMLQRFAQDDRTEPRHIALFHAITESWNEAGRPTQVEANHNSLIQLSRIGKTTYRKTLAELKEWEYISYLPATSRHAKSCLSFPAIVSKSDTVKQVTVSESDTINLCKPCSISDSGMIKQITTPESDTIDWVIVSEFGTVKPCIVSEFDKIGPFYRIKFRYDNHDYSQPVQVSAKTANGGHSFLPHNTNHLLKELSVISKGDDDEKRVQGKKQKREKSKSLPIGKFADSPLADLAKFQEAFASETTYQAADLDHYHARLLNWRDKSGNPPERADWLATAKTFLLNDYREGKLVTVTTTVKPTHNARPRNNSGSAVIEPESTAGRRFGNW